MSNNNGNKYKNNKGCGDENHEICLQTLALEEPYMGSAHQITSFTCLSSSSSS